MPSGPAYQPYGYVATPGSWHQPPYPIPARRGRSSWVGRLSLALVLLASSVPVISAVAARPVRDPGLHSVSGISTASWSAEFVDSSGLPARWDPCTPIRYVLDLAGAPAGAQADVQEAISRLEAASGLTFVDIGTTAERPSRDRAAYQPQSYGSAWAPVLISWASPAETDLLQDPRAEAVTVPIAVNSRSGTGGGSIVSAEVVVNTERQLPVGFGPGPSEGEVLMHELGHVVGLGHVANIGDAMYPTVRGIAAYGDGDLAGFAAVGAAAGCHAAPAARALNLLQDAQG